MHVCGVRGSLVRQHHADQCATRCHGHRLEWHASFAFWTGLREVASARTVATRRRRYAIQYYVAPSRRSHRWTTRKSLGSAPRPYVNYFTLNEPFGIIEVSSGLSRVLNVQVWGCQGGALAPAPG